MDKISVGDRVMDDYLGEGEVVRIIKNDYGDDGAYMVMFDKRPPIRYNMGENPCLVSPESLIKIDPQSEQTGE